VTVKRRVYRYVRRLANRFGVDITKYRPTTIEHPFNVLEFVIDHYLRDDATFNFIQIGANDGVRWDPLHALIIKHHLTGLLVEPLPDMFEQLMENYRSEPQLSFENAAVATESGTRTLFRITPDANVPDAAHGWASFNKEHLAADFKRHLQEVSVPTLTVKELLEKHSIERITLLQIDTEGYDYEILKMFFQERVFPEIINFEYALLSNNDYLDCRRALVDNGYRFIDTAIDTLAIKGGSPDHYSG
jgi:FkbM family methyltransferase